MGHSIQVIATTPEVAEAIRAAHPELRTVRIAHRFVLLPVDADFIDRVVTPRTDPHPNEFKLLTIGFDEWLCELSHLGRIAYLETDYFGGRGGQGAAVYSGGQVVLAPSWEKSGAINRALKLLGVKRGWLNDEFAAIGLKKFRSNDELIAATP